MRVLLQPGYLLHRRPFRESSELLEIFTAEYGRVGIVARGLTRKRRGGTLGSLLQPFRPLLFSFAGRGELANLSSVEAGGAIQPLGGKTLLSAFYLNELLVRLLHRNDPQPEVFSAYASTVGELASDLEADALEPVLRRFEFSLLDALGYGVALDVDADQAAPVAPTGCYLLAPERGLVSCHSERRDSYVGEELQAVAEGDYRAAPATAKRLARELLKPHLGERPLQSRMMFSQSPSDPEKLAAESAPSQQQPLTTTSGEMK